MPDEVAGGTPRSRPLRRAIWFK